MKTVPSRIFRNDIFQILFLILDYNLYTRNFKNKHYEKEPYSKNCFFLQRKTFKYFRNVVVVDLAF